MPSSFFYSSYRSDDFTGSSCVTSFGGRTVNFYWLCQRRWKSTRRGGLITDECFGSLFPFVYCLFVFCFGGFSSSCSGGKCEVQSGTHLKSKWSCTQLVMKAHCSDFVYTHTNTPLDSCHGDWSSKEHTQGYHETTKHYAENFVWYLGFWCIFLYIDYFFYFVLFSDMKVRGYGIVSDVFSLCITCHPQHFPCDFPCIHVIVWTVRHRSPKKVFVWPTGFCLTGVQMYLFSACTWRFREGTPVAPA